MNLSSKSVIAAIVATVYFLIYGVMYFFNVAPMVLLGMLMGSPVVLIYLVYTVVTDPKYKTRDLKEDEEFSYKDWPEASERKSPEEQK